MTAFWAPEITVSPLHVSWLPLPGKAQQSVHWGVDLLVTEQPPPVLDRKLLRSRWVPEQRCYHRPGDAEADGTVSYLLPLGSALFLIRSLPLGATHPRVSGIQGAPGRGLWVSLPPQFEAFNFN